MLKYRNMRGETLDEPTDNIFKKSIWGLGEKRTRKVTVGITYSNELL